MNHPDRAPWRRVRRSLGRTLLFSALVSCGDDSTAPLVPGQVAASGETSFTGVAGQPLATSPAVLVTTSDGKPVPAADVTFQVTGGGGQVVTATVPSNAQGVARAGAWILGPAVGANTMTATAAGLPAVTFTATASAGTAARLTAQSGDAQSGDIGSALTGPLVVRVSDRFGNPVSGASVSFAVTSGGGTFSSTTATSDASGDARTNLTLSQPGTSVITATSSAVAGTSVTFRADTGPTIVGELTIPAGPLRPFSGSVNGAPSRETSGLFTSSLDVGRAADALTPAEAARLVNTRGRLVVTFRPEAFELPAAAQAYRSEGVQQQAVAAYSAALAPMVGAGKVVQQAISPAIAAALVTVAPEHTQEDVIAELSRDPRVQAVEQDGVAFALHEGAREIPALTMMVLSARSRAMRMVRAAASPASERYTTDPIAAAQLWHYNMVDAPRTWVSQTGSSQVRVAIIDSGARPDHPAIGPVLGSAEHFDFVDGSTAAYSSAQPVCGNQGSFTTLRGRAQELALPRNAAQDPLQLSVLASAPTCWTPSSAGSHGSHVAGTIASAANDGIGGTGVSWNAQLIAVRALGVTGSGFYFDIAQAVLYAGGLPATFTGAGGTQVQMPAADVINMSLGGGGSSTVLANAIAAASANSLIIVAAGNDGTLASGYIPASYPQVMTVAALDPGYGLASYTNVGSPVDISAPGGDYRQGGSGGVASSTWNYQSNLATYTYYQGTSMAAPHVTGVAALVKAANPGFSPAQLRARLEQGAVDLGVPGRDDRFGVGVVNAYNAVTGRSGPVAVTTARAIDATTGAVTRTTTVGPDGRFVFANLPAGSYFVVAGQDEAGDGVQGIPGRRFGWLGARLAPLAMSGSTVQNLAIRLGAPTESEPNDDIGTAQPLVVNSWVAGNVGGADARDSYRLIVPTAGTYTFETSGVLGACGNALEVNTVLRLADTSNATIEENNDTAFPTSSTSTGTASYPGSTCSRISRTLQPGTYILEVRGSGSSSGMYRLHVKSGS